MYLKKEQKNEFELLVKQNMKRAYFVALGYLGNHDSAMDVSQEAFIRAYKHFDKFDKSRNFFTWYYKILKNLCLNFIRDNKNRKTEEFLEFRRKNMLTDSPDRIFEAKELQQNLQDSINKLNEDEKEILILREFEEMCYGDISELLNIPEGTVMSRLYYTRKKLSILMKRIEQ